MGYAVKITSRAVDVVSGADRQQGIVAAEATGVGASLRKKWGGGELRSRVVRSGQGWVVEGGSPYSSYANTPTSGAFTNTSPSIPASPFLNGNGSHTPALSPNPSTYGGPGLTASSPRIPSSGPPNMLSPGFSNASPYPPSPALSANGNYAVFPPTPNPANGAANGFPRSPIPGSPGFASHQAPPPPPPMMRRESGLRHSSSGSIGGTKKDD